jgi:actin-related protein 8
MQHASQNVSQSAVSSSETIVVATVTATPIKQKPFNLLSRLPQDDMESTPRSSVAGSPGPEGTPQPGRESPVPGATETTNGNGASDPSVQRIRAAEEQDKILPIMPLDTAIMTSIREASRGDDRKTRDFIGGIMLVGGGAKVPGFHQFLEDRLKEGNPGYTKEIIIGLPPRDLDQQLVCWKGGSVFARLSSSGNDSWVYRKEYDMLGTKLLAQKCMWGW